MDKVESRKLIGVTDLPITTYDGDLLQVENYIDGLVEFITNCHTPMTIALQGDWGTGKTSFINLVLDKLKKHNQNSEFKAHTVTFNTWKYSQFNKHDHLMISFLSYLISELLGKDMAEIYQEATEEQQECSETKKPTLAKRFVNTIFALSTDITKDIITSATVASLGLPMVVKSEGQNFGVEPEEEKNTNGKPNYIFEQSSALDSSVAIETLKGMFEEAVAEKLKAENCERIVIFIDDLDRLNPTLAVNLLEIIKLFLDIENCVFVLAVDYSVITQGLREKGNVAEGEALEAEKTQSFFDKMIQVPFRIPTELYQFDKFLTDHLKDYIQDSDRITELKTIIQKSVGSNPRAVKRLLNSFYLIHSIIKRSATPENKDEKNVILLAVLCMSLSFEPLYKYFCRVGGSGEIFDWEKKEVGGLLSAEEVSYKKKIEDLLSAEEVSYNEKDLWKFESFLNELAVIIFKGNLEEKGERSEKSEDYNAALADFKEAINLTNITNEKEIEDKTEIVEISLPEIIEYKVEDIGIEKLIFEPIEFKEKSRVGQVMELLEYVVGKDATYKEKLIDLYAMHDDEKAGIKTRLLLPLIREEQNRNPKKLAKEAPRFAREYGKYSEKLVSRLIPGTNLSITITYSPVDLCKNLLSLLIYLKFEDTDKIKVLVNKRN